MPGMPAMRDGKTVYDVLPDEFAREMEQMAQMGAWRARRLLRYNAGLYS